MTEDGYEAMFQVNHLSHLLLTLELLPIILDTASGCGDCRIIFVSSRLHASGSFSPGNMNAETEYSRTEFYSNSKLYNVCGWRVGGDFIIVCARSWQHTRCKEDSRIPVSRCPLYTPDQCVILMSIL